MAQFEIIVGSMLGASEYVADALQEKLAEHGHQSNIHLQPQLAGINQEARWLICTSTHGAGDLPDNIQAFAEQSKHADLSNIEFIVVGLGDSSYDTFCKGAMQMQDILQGAGASLLHTALHIDVLHHPIPEDAASAWLEQWLSTSATLG